MWSPFSGLYVSQSVSGRAGPCQTASSSRPSIAGGVVVRGGSIRGRSSAAAGTARRRRESTVRRVAVIDAETTADGIWLPPRRWIVRARAAVYRRGLPKGAPMESVLQDLRHAVRLLRRRPGFTLVSVATLALGLGGSVAIFSVADAVILRPLPYTDADRLLLVRQHRRVAHPRAA